MESRIALHGASLAILLSACGQVPVIPPPLDLPRRAAPADGTASPTEKTGTRFERVPGPPVTESKAKATQPSVAPTPTDGPAEVSLNFDQLPLPAFIQVVYGEILKRNVQIDPRVAERKDLVTLRSGGRQTAADVKRVAKQVLESYGVAVIDLDGLVRIVPDTAVAGYLPEIQRGAALPDTPVSLRPQFYLIELNSVRQTEVLNWLKSMFQERLKLGEDIGRNAILLSGAPDTIQSALDAIRVLDQPNMAGRQSLRIVPDVWSADDLAKRLFEALSAEGYAVQPPGQPLGGTGVRYPIILLPVAAINAIFVFANTPEILDHVQGWARTLDQPSTRGIGRNFLTYAVQNTDAAELADTLGQLLGPRATTAAGNSARPATSGATNSTAATPSSGGTGSVVVDKSSNTLIYQGNPEDYPQVRALLTTLDRPPKEALIEVTVAEVQLTGSWQFGVEWAFNGKIGNSTGRGSTIGGTGLGTGGFTYQLLGATNQIRAQFNAMATDSRTRILSSPRIMARNGQTASIEVGSDVPVITSQQSTLNATIGNQTGILQSVEYRTTGVILKVKPVIHSTDQIELDVSQEVSQAESTSTGVSGSPTFGTRKVSTNLTLKNGSTVLLGGLISNTNTLGDTGVPWLKDIPLLGNLFRSVTASNDRTELLVLITPYIVNDDYDAQAVTRAFRKQLGDWAAPEKGADPAAAPTLTPSPSPAAGKEGSQH
jgi:general secretion pathway protein D